MGSPVLIVYLEISTSRIMSSLVTFLFLISFTLMPTHTAPPKIPEECHEENGVIECCWQEKNGDRHCTLERTFTPQPGECDEGNGFVKCCWQKRNGDRHCTLTNIFTPHGECLEEENGLLQCCRQESNGCKRCSVTDPDIKKIVFCPQADLLA